LAFNPSSARLIAKAANCTDTGHNYQVLKQVLKYVAAGRNLIHASLRSPSA